MASLADVPQQAASNVMYIRDREKRMKKDLGMSPLEPYTERWKEIRSRLSLRKK